MCGDKYKKGFSQVAWIAVSFGLLFADYPTLYCDIHFRHSVLREKYYLQSDIWKYGKMSLNLTTYIEYREWYWKTIWQCHALIKPHIAINDYIIFTVHQFQNPESYNLIAHHHHLAHNPYIYIGVTLSWSHNFHLRGSKQRALSWVSCVMCRRTI